MKKFEVIITYSVSETLIVDAKDEDEAREKVFMGEYESVETEPLSDYHIDEVNPTEG